MNTERNPKPARRDVHAAVTRKANSEMNIKTVMWTILSGDFDSKISGDDCVNNVIKNMRPGSIIVFHDSAKAFDKINYALPKVLEEIKRRGWVTEKL